MAEAKAKNTQTEQKVEQTPQKNTRLSRNYG